MSAPQDKPTEVPPAAANARPASSNTKPAEWERLFEIGSITDLFASHHGAPMARYLREGDGALQFRGAAGGVSRRSVPARAGQVYRATATIAATGEGETAPIHFGPMFLNARDEVLIHSVQVPIKVFGEEQTLDVQSEAPTGAVSVRLRMVGAWARGQDTSGIICTYGRATLYRAKA
jgi:hypothetical protein